MADPFYESQFNIVVGVADDSGAHGKLSAQSCVVVIEQLKEMREMLDSNCLP